MYINQSEKLKLSFILNFKVVFNQLQFIKKIFKLTFILLVTYCLSY